MMNKLRNDIIVYSIRLRYSESFAFWTLFWNVQYCKHLSKPRIFKHQHKVVGSTTSTIFLPQLLLLRSFQPNRRASCCACSCNPRSHT